MNHAASIGTAASLTEPERFAIVCVAALLVWVVVALGAAWVDRREKPPVRRVPRAAPPTVDLVDPLSPDQLAAVPILVPCRERQDTIDENTIVSPQGFAHAFVDSVPTPPVAEELEVEHCDRCGAPESSGHAWTCPARGAA